jgi:tRNA(adenine34) deaminase
MSIVQVLSSIGRFWSAPRVSELSATVRSALAAPGAPPADHDRAMMRECIELSRRAASEGELPFGCVIERDGKVLVATTNRVFRDTDATRHAELLAISEAQRLLGRRNLRGCTLYTTVEPCPMCSWPIRETAISRVVFAIASPLMGGFSRWNVLGDKAVCDALPEVFRNSPEVVSGVLAREAEQVWRDWSLLIWTILKRRGCFAGEVESLGARDLVAKPEMT